MIGHRIYEMGSLKAAILTAVLLQIKAFVLYPRHYDQEVLPGEIQIFSRLGNKVLTLQICLYWPAVLIPNLIARVKYVAHRASCSL